MKNYYLAVLGLLTAAAIIVGISLHLGGFPFGKGFNMFGLGIGSGKMTSFGDEVEGVTDVNIDAKIMDINIVYGDKFSYEYEGRDDLKPDISVNDGELKVKQSGNKPKGINGNYKCNLNIEIPEDAKFGFFKADLNMGNLVVEGFEAEDVDFDLSMGNVEVKELKAENIDIDADMGNVEIFSAEFKELHGEANMGNVVVQSVNDLDDYDIEASTNMGDINIDGKNVSKNYNTKGDAGKIRISANMGNVEIYSK